MNWQDKEEIGIALYEKYPDLDPLTVRFTDLHKMILDIPEFDGDARASTEAKLEAIQMAWLDEFQNG